MVDYISRYHFRIAWKLRSFGINIGSFSRTHAFCERFFLSMRGSDYVICPYVTWETFFTLVTFSVDHACFQWAENSSFFAFLFLGNPLNCDCDTLWLRNWVSDEKSAIQDNPICYFPKQLSGNPLRKLRTSRFTCGPYRSSEIIQDACQGIPVKPPVQQSLAVGLSSGT